MQVGRHEGALAGLVQDLLALCRLELLYLKGLGLRVEGLRV